jgi:hypothetical protein
MCKCPRKQYENVKLDDQLHDAKRDAFSAAISSWSSQTLEDSLGNQSNKKQTLTFE